jgi:membrane associated rhomboid family serine protease
MPEAAPAACSLCGRLAPRGEMFGAPPDLLCAGCAEALRERLAPRATGRVLGVGSDRAPVTVALIAASVALYAFQVLLPKDEYGLPPLIWALRMWSRAGSVVDGEVWRVFTPALLHGGLLHLGMNAMALWVLGRVTETIRGSVFLLFLFATSAVAGNAMEGILLNNPVGLSGGIFGVAAALWAWRGEEPLAGAVMNPQTTRFLVTFFFLGIALSLLGVVQFANWAHGVGALTGLALGMVSRRPWRRAGYALVCAGAVGLALALCLGVTR